MRTTSLAAALALLIAGCGIDRDPTGSEGRGPRFRSRSSTFPSKGSPSPRRPRNVWRTKAPMPTARRYLAVGAGRSAHEIHSRLGSVLI
jgi:hypothetical protein